jgi:hypothetical protein
VIAKLGIKNQSFKIALDLLLDIKNQFSNLNWNEKDVELFLSGMETSLDGLIDSFSKCAKSETT